MTMGGSVRALTLLKGKGSQRILSSLLTGKSLVVRSSSSLVNNTNRVNDNRTLGAPWSSSFRSVGVVPNRLFSLSSRFRRAYPQYNIHGEEAMMSVKMIPPTFRAVKSDSVVMDQSRRGRLLLEFTARSSGRNYDWSNKIRFALSAEEVGLVCSQVPQHTVELVRKGHTTTTPFDDDSDSDSDDDDDYFGPVTNNMPDKVLTVTPGDVGTVSFRLDFIKDGVGGNKVTFLTHAHTNTDLVC